MKRFILLTILSCLLCLPSATFALEPASFVTNPHSKPTGTLEGAAGQPQPAIAQRDPEIYLNFENASLASVLNYLTDRQNLDVIPHKDLENVKVSLTSHKPMTLKQAWEAMYTLLEANNFGIVQVNGKNKVVSMQEVSKNPLPCLSSAKGIGPEELEDSSKMIRYIYFCSNIKASIAQGILTPLLSEGSVQVNETLQACIITEKSINIKSAMRIVKELDMGGLRQAIKIKRLKHTNAAHITRLFNEHIMQGGQEQQDNRIRIISNQKKQDSSFFSKETKIIPDPINNKLILMGTLDAIDKVIDFIDKYLDIPLGTAKSRLRVKELKYMAAEKMKGIIERIIKPTPGQGSEDGSRTKFFQDVIITAEAPHTGDDNEQGKGAGNRLIISCGDDDWRRLSAFIDKLDKAQPQVAMEVMIVDIKNDGVNSLGAQTRAKENMLGKNVTGSSFMLPAANATVGATNLITDVRGTASESPLSAHSTILSFGDTTSGDVWAMIRAAYKIDHTNIISQPYLVANNNSTCEENVMSRRKIAGKLESSNSTVATGLYRRIEDVDASVKTIIRPRVNASGMIELKIDIEVSEFKEDVTTSADKTDRKLQTRAIMAAGEVLVLGGLTSSKHDNSQWHVPILGSLPLIGNFFRDRTKQSVKKNLYLFIRPTVLKPHFGAGVDAYSQLKLDYAKYQILSNDDFAINKDPVQRYFFAPRRYGIKNKLEDLANNRMPLVDNFAERKFTPSEVKISHDPYFKKAGSKHSEKQGLSNEYLPESAGITMPHIDPASYISPGLLEDSMPKELLDQIQQELSEQSKPIPPVSPGSFGHMQRRSTTIGQRQ